LKLKNLHDFEILFRFAKPHERTAYVNQLFARIAPKYDYMNRLMSLGQDLTWRRKAIKKAAFEPDSTILDLGVGSGDMSKMLLEEVPGVNVVGFDICEELIAEGRRKPALQSQSNPIQWLIGDGRMLPFADHRFDGIVAGFSIRNIPELPKVFREMYRVVKPGGKIVLLDMVEPENPVLRALFKTYFKYIIPPVAQYFATDPEAYCYLYPSIVNFHTAAKIRQSFIELACKEVESEDLMLQMVTICVAQK
jgi:demethylmenaquinone methyltransferase/2-methoxy-6-polyprenyl-1,4-benzoquinol methylase